MEGGVGVEKGQGGLYTASAPCDLKPGGLTIPSVPIVGPPALRSAPSLISHLDNGSTTPHRQVMARSALRAPLPFQHRQPANNSTAGTPSRATGTSNNATQPPWPPARPRTWPPPARRPCPNLFKSTRITKSWRLKNKIFFFGGPPWALVNNMRTSLHDMTAAILSVADRGTTEKDVGNALEKIQKV